MVAGFWLAIAVLLAARVAWFDDIAAARVASFVSTQVAWLAADLR